MGVLLRAVVVWVLFVVGVVGGLVLVFVPPVTLSSVHSWDVVRGEPVMTGLVRPAAEAITVVGSCGVGGGASGELLEADNWSVSVRGQDVEVASPLGGDVILSSVLPGSCGFEVAYSLTNMAVTVTVVDDSTGVVISQESAVVPEAFRVSGFGVSGVGEPVFDQVVVETFPWGLGFSPVRFIGQVLVFGAVGLLVLRTVLRDRASPPAVGDVEVFPRVGSRWSRWTIHGSVLVALVAGMMLFPSHTDDGWVFHRITESLRTGLFSEPYEASDAWMVQGLWIERSLSVLVKAGASFEVLRLLFASGLAWAWWFCVRNLERLGYLRRTSEFAILASVFVAFSLALLMSIRQEPVVTVLAAAFFTGFLGFVHRPSESYLILAGLSAVAAGTAHQSGFVLLFPALLLVGIAIWHAANRMYAWQSVFAPILASLGFGLGLGLIDYDLASLLREAQGLRDEEYNRYSEVYRWSLMLSEPGWIWWPLVLFGAGVLVSTLTFQHMSNHRALILLGAAVAPLGLYLTASKWQWHWGALTIPALILVALSLPVIRGNFHGTRLRTAVFSGALLAGALAMVGTINREGLGSSNWSYPFRVFSDGTAIEIFGGDFSYLSWLLLPTLPVLFLLAVRLGGILASKSERLFRLVATTLIVVVSLAPVGNHYGMLVADSLVWQGWTPFKQRVANLAGVHNCGLLDELDIVVGARKLGEPGPSAKTNSLGPFGLPVFSLNHANPTVRINLYEGAEEIVLWTKANQAGDKVLVSAITPAGPIDVLDVTLNTNEYWMMWSLSSGKDWSEVVVTGSFDQSRFSGLLVTTPAFVQKSKALETVSGKVVASGPSVSTYIPCSIETRKIDGRPEQPDFVLGTNLGLTPFWDWIESEKIEVAFRVGTNGSFITLLKVE